MVINDKDEVLVIQERHFVVPHWKLPGGNGGKIRYFIQLFQLELFSGYVDPGEDISAAAVREVKEETGIETQFQSIIAFRSAFTPSL